MKKYKYVGVFKSDCGHTHDLEVYCNGFLQAFFLLTADAIRCGKHYQLYTITDDDYNVKHVDDILKCGNILS